MNVALDFNVMLQIMKENVIRPNDYIEFSFEDGTLGAVQKKYVNGFCESREEA